MQPLTLAQLIDAFVFFPRPEPIGSSALGRLAYWREALGTRAVLDITADEVDQALVALQARGRLRPRRKRPSEPTGQPLRPSTVNRYISTFGELYRHARRLRLIPRTHLSPLTGLERAPEPIDPNRYLRVEDVERLITVARVLDRRWGRLPVLIRLAFTTGIRRGNLQALRWADVDLDAKTVTVLKTKNGRPHVAPLTEQVVTEPSELPRSNSPDELVFVGRRDRAHDFRSLWTRTCKQAGLPGRNFHQLRHGTATALARANVNQAALMAAMGHRTLAASARYLHHDIEDRRAVIAKVFGR